MKISNKEKISQDEKDNLCNPTAEEGPGTDRRGPTGDGAMCRGGRRAPRLCPLYLFVRWCSADGHSSGTRLPASTLQVNNNMQPFFFTARLFDNCELGVYGDNHFLFCFIFSVCLEAWFEGDPFVSNQRHQGKPAPWEELLILAREKGWKDNHFVLWLVQYVTQSVKQEYRRDRLFLASWIKRERCQVEMWSNSPEARLL